jgi:K+-transporting ATPase ATPase B chain
VVRDGKLFGVMQLKDIVKGGIRERFAELRRMGIRTVMITGDNPMTAAAIAAEAGVDDFLAQATPENKLSSSVRNRPRASSSPCAATAPTTPRRWPRPMSASP